MTVAHGSAPLALAPVVVTTITIAAATPAPVEAESEDQVDEVIASALEGISLALSMDDPLGFSNIRELEIQGEPPQVSSVSSSLS